MKKKYINAAVGVDFYDVLMTHEAFQKNWEVISPCFFLCRKIAEGEYDDHRGMRQVHSHYIGNMFQPYTGGEYWKYMLALRDLGLLMFDDAGYQSSEDGTGECRVYAVTENACDLLFHSNMEYLRKLRGDKKEKQKNHQRKSMKKSRHVSYGDFVCDYIHDVQTNLSYDMEGMEALMDGMEKDETKANLSGTLTKIETHNFTPLKRSEKDGRIFNDFAAMNSDGKTLVSYRKMVYRGVIDMRSAHPTYWSTYILSQIDNPTNEMMVEHGKWLEIFTDPSVDPKDYVGSKVGYDRDTTKKALNQTLNGCSKYPELMVWWKSNFPELYAAWRKTNVIMTGCKIAKIYETSIMLDPQLYRYTEEMKIKFGYEYDGVGVFAKENDDTLADKMQFIGRWITHTSINRFGVPIIVKIKLFK